MNIYVGNLNYRLEVSELQAAFEAHGEVTSARIITDRETRRSKGFGFVEMPNDDQARAAIEALEGFELNGRSMRVTEAKPREEKV